MYTDARHPSPRPPLFPYTTLFRSLSTIASHTELGAGIQVAMKDLEIRGAGNLLGGEQSGHIAGVGFDLYVRMVADAVARSEEHTSELQSRGHLVCRLLLEKKKTTYGGEPVAVSCQPLLRQPADAASDQPLGELVAHALRDATGADLGVDHACAASADSRGG